MKTKIPTTSKQAPNEPLPFAVAVPAVASMPVDEEAQVVEMHNGKTGCSKREPTRALPPSTVSPLPTPPRYVGGTIEIESNLDYCRDDVDFKRGHSFCGCCCDMRRAVIIINTLSLIVASIALLALIPAGLDIYDDDFPGQGDGNEDELDSPAWVAAMLYVILTIAALSFGIHGAKYFQLWCVMAALTWYTVAVAIMIASFFYWEEVEGLIFLILLQGVVWFYPNAVLVFEMRAHIMTQELYQRERQSCCCLLK